MPTDEATTEVGGAAAAGRRRPTRWWWLLETATAGLLAASLWYGGGDESAMAIGGFALACFAAFVTFLFRAVQIVWTGRAGVARAAVAPLLMFLVVALRGPVMAAVFDFRFAHAEPVLTAAAVAYLEDPSAPVPSRAGWWTISDRRRTSDGVVFFLDGAGPLFLHRCGFAYLPEGRPGLEHLDGPWYRFCD